MVCSAAAYDRPPSQKNIYQVFVVMGIPRKSPFGDRGYPKRIFDQRVQRTHNLEDGKSGKSWLQQIGWLHLAYV